MRRHRWITLTLLIALLCGAAVFLLIDRNERHTAPQVASDKPFATPNLSNPTPKVENGNQTKNARSIQIDDLKNADVLSTYESPPDSEGNIARVRIVRSREHRKYTLLRIEETDAIDPVTH